MIPYPGEDGQRELDSTEYFSKTKKELRELEGIRVDLRGVRIRVRVNMTKMHCL